MIERSSGVLMPRSSLPSPYGIGTMGKSAFRFVDFLAAAGQKYWQLLPLGPTSYGDSPYQSFSSFAGNPYYIDLDMLVEEGLLDGSEVESTVRASVQPLLDEGADIIVLGCTHYPFLRPVIQRIAGDSVRIIDPAPAVAKRTADILLERGLIGKENVRNLEAVPDTVDSSFYSSGLPDSMGRILRYL